MQPTRLATADDFEAALAASTSGPAWILKHSDECYISDQAIEEFWAHADQHDDGSYWLLTVQASPGLSMVIAAQLGVAHETPQVILLRQRQVRWVATHGDISAVSLEQARARLEP